MQRHLTVEGWLGEYSCKREFSAIRWVFRSYWSLRIALLCLGRIILSYVFIQRETQIRNAKKTHSISLFSRVDINNGYSRASVAATAMVGLSVPVNTTG